MKFEKGDYIAQDEDFDDEEIDEKYIYQVTFVNKYTVRVKQVNGWGGYMGSPKQFRNWEKVNYYKNSALWQVLND